MKTDNKEELLNEEEEDRFTCPGCGYRGMLEEDLACPECGWDVEWNSIFEDEDFED